MAASKSGFMKDALILFAITLVSGLCLGVVYDVTKAPIEAALQKLKDAHKAQDMTTIDSAMAELNTAFQAASAEMYAQSGAQGGAQAGPDMNAGQSNAGQNNGKQDDNVQDADFEEVK